MRIILLILGLIIYSNIFSQNISEFEPELVEYRYRDANVSSYENPFLKSTYYYDSNGFMKQSVIDGLRDSIKFVKYYIYDSLNSLLIIKKETFIHDFLKGTHFENYTCSDFGKILKEPYLDFKNDSRLKINDFKNDTIFIYKLEYQEIEKKNQGGWYAYDTKQRTDSLLNKIAIINSYSPNKFVVSYNKPDTNKTVYSEQYEFDNSGSLIRIIERHSTHTHDNQILTKHGLIKKIYTNTTRRDEDFIYSISRRKYKYNKHGLLVNQKTETKYLIQGHTTKTDFNFNYEFK